MSAQDLDQSTIDQLFAATEAEPKFTAVNFQTRKSLTSVQMQLLAVENQVFSRNIGSRLSSWLNADVKISMLSAERLLFSDYLEGSDINSMYAGEARLSGAQPALVCCDFSFVSAVINLVLGGLSHNSQTGVRRDLTSIDTAVMDILLGHVCGELTQSWTGTNLDAIHRNAIHPANIAKLFAHGEYLLVFTYEMKIETVEGVLQIVLSTTTADTVLRELDHQEASHAQAPETRELLQQRIGQTRHKIHLRSQAFPLRVADILGLTPGTVLYSGLMASCPVRLAIAGGKTLVAVPSQRNGRVVAQLLERATAHEPGPVM